MTSCLGLRTLDPAAITTDPFYQAHCPGCAAPHAAQLAAQLADVTAQRDLLMAMCPAEKENAQLRAHLARQLTPVERACVNLARRDLGLTIGPDVKAWYGYAHKLCAAVTSLLAIIDKLAPTDLPDAKEKP